jgi:hypothetical protein
MRRKVARQRFLARAIVGRLLLGPAEVVAWLFAFRAVFVVFLALVLATVFAAFDFVAFDFVAFGFAVFDFAAFFVTAVVGFLLADGDAFAFPLPCACPRTGAGVVSPALGCVGAGTPGSSCLGDCSPSAFSTAAASFAIHGGIGLLSRPLARASICSACFFRSRAKSSGESLPAVV